MRLIDADELKKAVGSYNPMKFTWEYGYVISLEDIDHAPTIDPVKHGRWIYSAGFDLDGVTYAGRYRCDQCNHWIDAGDDGNYCPNCGAKMDEVE